MKLGFKYYGLALGCDSCKPGELTLISGKSRKDCVKKAISDGWKLVRKKEICPDCATKKYFFVKEQANDETN